MRVVELDELKLVGFRVRCEGDQYAAEIPKAAVRLKARLAEIEHAVEPKWMVGAFKPVEDGEEDDGYWLGVRVEQFGEVPAGMTTITVPPQRYALKWHYGPNTEVGKTYERLHRLIREAGLEREPDAWNVEIGKRWGEPMEAGGTVELELYETIKP
ncbi:AraC family transcriptional regulator [Paenibacillus flagellatus]|uniref:AraC family transcriptional regulator n=2 Tax=Paenibacillus flagellatus TaxID=2211139 RepID=A0A2V5K9M6_9BACL|nr:AraC family transcriptional regulator [Paenibacillus flagellatus]